jgi:hypothetical protein
MATSLPGSGWLWSLTSAPENQLLSEPVRGPNLRKPTRICFGEIQHAYLLDLILFGASRNICSVVSIDGSIESMVHVLDMYYPSLR